MESFRLKFVRKDKLRNRLVLASALCLFIIPIISLVLPRILHGQVLIVAYIVVVAAVPMLFLLLVKNAYQVTQVVITKTGMSSSEFGAINWAEIRHARLEKETILTIQFLSNERLIVRSANKYAFASNDAFHQFFTQFKSGLEIYRNR